MHLSSQCYPDYITLPDDLPHTSLPPPTPSDQHMEAFCVQALPYQGPGLTSSPVPVPTTAPSQRITPLVYFSVSFYITQIVSTNRIDYNDPIRYELEQLVCKALNINMNSCYCYNGDETDSDSESNGNCIQFKYDPTIIIIFPTPNDDTNSTDNDIPVIEPMRSMTERKEDNQVSTMNFDKEDIIIGSVMALYVTINVTLNTIDLLTLYNMSNIDIRDINETVTLALSDMNAKVSEMSSHMSWYYFSSFMPIKYPTVFSYFGMSLLQPTLHFLSIDLPTTRVSLLPAISSSPTLAPTPTVGNGMNSGSSSDNIVLGMSMQDVLGISISVGLFIFLPLIGCCIVNRRHPCVEKYSLDDSDSNTDDNHNGESDNYNPHERDGDNDNRDIEAEGVNERREGDRENEHPCLTTVCPPVVVVTTRWWFGLFSRPPAASSSSQATRTLSIDVNTTDGVSQLSPSPSPQHRVSNSDDIELVRDLSSSSEDDRGETNQL